MFSNQTHLFLLQLVKLPSGYVVLSITVGFVSLKIRKAAQVIARFTLKFTINFNVRHGISTINLFKGILVKMPVKKCILNIVW